MSFAPSTRRLTAAAIAAALVFGAATAANADTFAPDAGTDETAPVELDTTGVLTQVVSVTLVAVTDDGSFDGCNLQSEQGHSVTASVTSNDTSVATVSPSTLTFTNCGQSEEFTITAVAAGETTVTIAKASSTPAGGPRSIFSSATVYVTVTDDDDDDDNGEIIVCDNPAAPAWAAHILKANPGVVQKGKGQPNHVSEVARLMTQGATFMDVPKSEQDAYSAAVLDYLEGRVGQVLNFPADWPSNDCTTNGTA